MLRLWLSLIFFIFDWLRCSWLCCRSWVIHHSIYLMGSRTFTLQWGTSTVAAVKATPLQGAFLIFLGLHVLGKFLQPFFFLFYLMLLCQSLHSSPKSLLPQLLFQSRSLQWGIATVAAVAASLLHGAFGVSLTPRWGTTTVASVAATLPGGA